jgi:hypothetical protein
MPARANASSKTAIITAVCAVVLIALVIAGCAARFHNDSKSGAADTSLLQLKKGSQFNYVGTLEWTVGTNVSRTNIDWVMEVVDVVKGERAEAAVVRGFLRDLAWYEPGEKPGFTVIASEHNRVYEISCEDESRARARAETIATKGMDPNAEAWLDLPLKNGKRWEFNPERIDLWYCWYVEDEELRTYAAPGLPTREKARTWSIVYRTAPDHQIFKIADGVGIVGFEYGHHGTVASAKVALSGMKSARN